MNNVFESVAIIKFNNGEESLVKTFYDLQGILNFLEDRKNNMADEIIYYNYNLDILEINEIIWLVDGLVITGYNKDQIKIFGQETKEAQEIINKYKNLPVEEVETWEYPRGP